MNIYFSRNIFLVAITACLLGCNSYDLHNINENLEYQNLKLYGYASDPENKIVFQLPANVQWKSGPTTKRPNIYTYSWLPKNQNTENQQQLITQEHINFKVTKKTTAKGLASLDKLDAMRACDEVDFKFLKEQDQDASYEETTKNCGDNKKIGNRWIVGRVLKGEDGFYILRYSIAADALTPELKKSALTTIQRAGLIKLHN